MENTGKSNSEKQAEAQLESITEMVKALHQEADDRDDALQAITEDPLSIEVRSDWHELNSEPEKPSEYKILLCWGGPAVRIIGELEDSEPKTVQIEYQDWGTLWTELHITSEQEEILLEYARCFYFGD
jgi:hypothetical protein